MYGHPVSVSAQRRQGVVLSLAESSTEVVEEGELNTHTSTPTIGLSDSRKQKVSLTVPSFRI